MSAYDVTSVWLVLWLLCISRRPGRLFGTQHLVETWRLLEHWPFIRDPTIILEPPFNRSFTVCNLLVSVC